MQLRPRAATWPRRRWRADSIDRIGNRREFEDRLADLGGEAGKDDKDSAGFARIKLSSYVSDVVEKNPKGPVGIVTVAGMIVDGKAGPGTAGGDTIADEIADGVKNGIKALVVRVDSPGGSVLASERIRQALLDAKAKKIPVVVSMGSVAASGGYWVSTPADFIYAEPSTITGSIGVFGIIPSFQGTLQKLGIGADGVKTTPLSGEPDLFKGPSPEANQLIQSGVNSIYGRFLSIVAAARHKSPQQVDEIAQGRVWDGGTAHQLGLVDGFGGIDEAVAKAAQLAGLGNERSVRYLEPRATFKRGADRGARVRARRHGGATGCVCVAGPRPAAAARRDAHGGTLNPEGSEHPGALPRLPAGGAGTPRQPRPQPSRLAQVMVVLIRR